MIVTPENYHHSKSIGNVTPETFRNEIDYKKYILVKYEFLDYEEDIQTLKSSISLLTDIQYLVLINELLKNVKSNIFIDTQPFYKMLYHMQNDIPFERENVRNLFDSIKQLEQCMDHIYKIIDIDKLYIDVEHELVALGLPIKRYLKLNDKQREKLIDEYFGIRQKYFNSTIAVDEFIDDFKIMANKVMAKKPVNA